MQIVLIKNYDIPASVRKQFAKYTSMELYTNRLVGKGNPNGDITYFFKNYMDVTWTPASLATQFAQLVFITHENANSYVSANNIANFNDINKIPFCSGMFNYATANGYVQQLCMDIKAAMREYQMHKDEIERADTNVVQAALSPADEIKKFKELLDCGVITEEEFAEKKKQLLGL